MHAQVGAQGELGFSNLRLANLAPADSTNARGDHVVQALPVWPSVGGEPGATVSGHGNTLCAGALLLSLPAAVRVWRCWRHQQPALQLERLYGSIDSWLGKFVLDCRPLPLYLPQVTLVNATVEYSKPKDYQGCLAYQQHIVQQRLGSRSVTQPANGTVLVTGRHVSSLPVTDSQMPTGYAPHPQMPGVNTAGAPVAALMIIVAC